MTFATLSGVGGFDTFYQGTPDVDVLVAFNSTGTVYVGGQKEADSITFFQPDVGVLETTTVQAGEGGDTIVVGFNTALTRSLLNGNKGNDFIRVDSFEAVTESVILGGDGDDEIFPGFTAPETIVSSTVNGNLGNDLIEFDGSLASSRIFGGDGSDTIILDDGFAGTLWTDSRINGNKGNDVIDGTFLETNVSTTTVFGGEGADTINFFNAVNTAGPTAGFILSGDLGNDQITGTDLGDDSILGGDGNDTITATAGEDTVVGAAGADVYNGATGADVVTYVIDAVSDSAAAVSGTARTFDQFETAGSFAGDDLDISAVASGLAGGPVTAFTGVDQTDIDLLIGGVYADFSELQADINSFGGFDGSDVGDIETYIFTASIAGGAFNNYLWINDSQNLYSSSDLLFQTAGFGQIGAGNIVI